MTTITGRFNVYGADAAELHELATAAGRELAGKAGTLESVELEIATRSSDERGPQRWGAVAVLTVTLPEPDRPVVVPDLEPLEGEARRA